MTTPTYTTSISSHIITFTPTPPIFPFANRSQVSTLLKFTGDVSYWTPTTVLPHIGSTLIPSNFVNYTIMGDDITNEDSEGEYVPYNKRAETYIVPIVFAIIFFVGIIGNGLLIYAVLSHKALRNNAPNIYILNLSIGDFVLILISVPFTSTIYTFESWPYGTILCKTTEFWRALSVAVSVYTLTALSADRYHAIVDPLGRYVGGRKTVRRTLLTCGAIWVMGVGIASLDAVNSYVLVLPRYEELVAEKADDVASPYNMTLSRVADEMMSFLAKLNDGNHEHLDVPSNPRVAASLFILIFMGNLKSVAYTKLLFTSWFPNLDFQRFQEIWSSAVSTIFTTTSPIYNSKTVNQLLEEYSAPIMYLLNMTTNVTTLHENVGAELPPLKVCYPYPEKYGDNYKRWHTLIKFLLLLVVPFSIITVYYVLMAKRLIMSTTDVPNASYATSLPRCHLSNKSTHRYSSPESTKPFLSKSTLEERNCNPPSNESGEIQVPNGYDQINFSDETLLSNNVSTQPNHSPSQMSHKLQIPQENTGVKSSIGQGDEQKINNNNSKSGRNRLSSLRASKRNSFLSLKDKMIGWSFLAERGASMLSVSQSQQSIRNSSTCALSNSPNSTIFNGNYAGGLKGSFSYFRRKLSSSGALNARNFSYAVRVNKQMDSRKKVAKMVLIVVLLFLICWLPHHVFMMWFHFDPHAVDKYNYAWHSLKLLGFTLSYLNSCINPIVLYFISNTYHKYFNQYLSLQCWRGTPPGKKFNDLTSTDTIRTRQFSRQNTFNRTFKRSSTNRYASKTASTVLNERSTDNAKVNSAHNANGKIIKTYDLVKVINTPITVKVEYESGTSDSYFDLTVKKPRSSLELNTTPSVSL